MYCYRCSARPPPTHADLSFATRVFTCGHSQSGAPRSQSVPHRFRNIKQSTTLRSRSARRLNIHERRSWYEGPRTREKSDAVSVEGGEPQRQVPSCDTGIYKRLDESKRQIRLLELHPGSGEEPISGNLVTVELPVLPLDFSEEIFFNELVAIADRKIVLAVRFGKWILQDGVDRWELIQNSLSWLFRYRLHASFRILRDTCGAPTLETVDRLKAMRLSYFANFLQKIPMLLATTLLSYSAHNSWTHDLNGLIARLSAQGTRDRHLIVHFAEQMDTAVDKFISEGSDGGSALTSVDITGLNTFLAEVNLPRYPVFSAVSWFWGDAKPGQKMVLDERYLEVPWNAIRALRDLRDTNLPKRLWIDAVCINQDDKAERASQILLMSDIYSFAELTYVWLGICDSAIQLAISTLEFVLKYCEEATVSPEEILKELDTGDNVRRRRPAHVSVQGLSPRPISGFRAVPDDMQAWIEDGEDCRRTLGQVLRTFPAGHRLTQAQWQSLLNRRAPQTMWALFKLPWFNRL
jgi:hypothetical protein